MAKLPLSYGSQSAQCREDEKASQSAAARAAVAEDAARREGPHRAK